MLMLLTFFEHRQYTQKNLLELKRFIPSAEYDAAISNKEDSGSQVLTIACATTRILYIFLET